MGIDGAINNDTSSWFVRYNVKLAATDFYAYSCIDRYSLRLLQSTICWSAFNVFGGSPLLGLVLGLMMVNNALPNAWDVIGCC